MLSGSEKSHTAKLSPQNYEQNTMTVLSHSVTFKGRLCACLCVCMHASGVLENSLKAISVKWNIFKSYFCETV